MAHYGGDDSTLLETMLKPFLPHEDSTETDLKKYLTSDNDELDEAKLSESDEFPLEVLFTRDDPLLGYDDLQSLAPLQPVNNGNNVEGSPEEKLIKSRKFLQTRNKDYRTFMEEVMLIKCCSKKILESLEDTKPILEQYISIKNDPGFGRVHATQGWVWILKEAIVSSLCTVRNDKRRKKLLESFLTQMLYIMEQCFKQLVVDMKNVSRTFSKVWGELEMLAGKTYSRFFNNIESSLEYEIRTSGYNFFFHRKDSADSLAEPTRQVITEKSNSLNKNVGESMHQCLRVRCSIDGVTLRTGMSDSSWLKFQKIDQDRDIMLLLNIFITKMTEICANVRKNIALVNELLEVHNMQKRSSSHRSDFNESVLQSILKCQEILSRPRSEVNFYPKEAVIMLYTVKSTKAAFELIRPLLIEFALSTDRQFTIVQEFSKQQKQLKKGTIQNRFPVDLNASFELLIEDTKVNTDMILNRYPNIRDAKLLKEKLLKKYSDTGCFPERDNPVIGEMPTDILYKCPSQVFCAQSTQEMIEMFRKLIFKQRNVINPNPAHYLFTDVEQEYVALTKELTTSRTITPEMLSLCCDPIQRFHQAAVELSSFKDKMLTQIVYSIQKVTSTQSGVGIEKKEITPMSSWIQAICKILHIWHFHKLQKPLQSHFLAKNETTMRWIAKLEEGFREFTILVKEYKEEFYQFQDFIEVNHGFITWIRRLFYFNPPNEILKKWEEQLQEDDAINDHDCKLQDSSDDAPKFQLKFHDFDMHVVQINPREKCSKALVTLNKSSGNVQIGIVTSFFAYIDQIVSSAIVSLNSARAIHEKYISLKPLKDALSPDKRLSYLKYIYQLEDLVLALTFEMVHKDLKETISYVGLLNRTISQFNTMFQTVQLHLEERGILVTEVDPPSGSMKRKYSKKDIYFETDHYNHDKYLSESVQLLKSSVEAMPNVFDVQAEELVNSLVSWAKLAEKDDKLAAMFQPDDLSLSDNEKVEIEGRETDEINNDLCPINFEEAMMLTTTGKAFFPDPERFSSGIECWRAICFKMLAAALDKFREMTTTKINDTKTALSSPQLSQTSIQEQTTAPKVSSVGYTEGLCSLLCFVTGKLAPRDRSLVSSVDLKLLKDKFATATRTVEKFKRGLDTAEKVLVNSLSLSMASVEHKRLPQYLPVLPMEDDFLKSHDLEEVGSMLSLSIKKDVHDEKSSTHIGININDMPNTDDLMTTDFIEIHWDSLNKQEILCKSCVNGGDSAWIQFTQLHISGQLHVIHIVLNELVQEFEKAIALVKEAKTDLVCAKKLLEKTWKGIGNDMKKKIIPGSGIVVLLKLYRHQVGTAVVNLKAIRKITGEVKYLLSQSTQNVNLWTSDKNNAPPYPTEILDTNNYIMNQDNLSLSVRLKTSSPGNNWLTIDQAKMAELEDADATEITTKSKVSECKNIVEIMGAVQVISSVSFINPKGGTGLQSSDDIDSNTSRTMANATLTRANLKENNVNDGGNHKDFLAAAASIEQLILSELSQTVAILRLPNCSTHVTPSSREHIHEVTNVMGVVTAFIAVTMDIRLFKEVMPQERDFMLSRIFSVQEKISRMLNNRNGLIDAISIESKKIKKNVESLDANIRSKFSFDGEYPPMEEVLTATFQPTYRITPMEFVEGLAASLDGHVWTVACGVPDIGTLIKNNKTLESHALANIPLSSKLEAMISIINYLENIMSHVQSNLESAKKDVASAKSLLKSKGKDITTTNYKRLLGVRWGREDIVMSKREIKDHLQNFARISNACTKAQEHLDHILDLLSRANEILQQVTLYLNLKFKLEPSVGSPNVDNEVYTRAQNWQSVDIITGIASPPNVPPPVILKKIVKRSQKQENAQIKYKAAWEHRILELEVHFVQFCKKNIAVDIPIVFIPVSTAGDDDAEYYEN